MFDAHELSKASAVSIPAALNRFGFVILLSLNSLDCCLVLLCCFPLGGFVRFMLGSTEGLAGGGAFFPVTGAIGLDGDSGDEGENCHPWRGAEKGEEARQVPSPALA